MTLGLSPGSFDPPTNGHLDLILRASLLCKKLIVSVSTNPQKRVLFSPEKRVELIQAMLPDNQNIEVVQFDGLTADFAKQRGASFFVRGLRSMSDFECEHQMAFANYKLSGLETIFLMARAEHAQISSSLIREIASFKGSLEGLVPKIVEETIRKI